MDDEKEGVSMEHTVKEEMEVTKPRAEIMARVAEKQEDISMEDKKKGNKYTTTCVCHTDDESDGCGNVDVPDESNGGEKDATSEECFVSEPEEEEELDCVCGVECSEEEEDNGDGCPVTVSDGDEKGNSCPVSLSVGNIRVGVKLSKKNKLDNTKIPFSRQRHGPRCYRRFKRRLIHRCNRASSCPADSN
nr:hypothetical transcript [Hymenolepis microstoma]